MSRVFCLNIQSCIQRASDLLKQTKLCNSMHRNGATTKHDRVQSSTAPQHLLAASLQKAALYDSLIVDNNCRLRHGLGTNADAMLHQTPFPEVVKQLLAHTHELQKLHRTCRESACQSWCTLHQLAGCNCPSDIPVKS